MNSGTVSRRTSGHTGTPEGGELKIASSSTSNDAKGSLDFLTNGMLTNLVGGVVSLPLDESSRMITVG